MSGSPLVKEIRKVTDLKQKRQEERSREVAVRKEQVVAAAVDCFREKGIEASTISMIALRAGVGDATVYRYFDKKENLAVECGIFIWKRITARFEELCDEEEYHCLSGIGQVEALMTRALAIFAEEQKDFRFLYEFDRYLLSHHIERDRLADYEASVNGSRRFLCGAIEKGREDGSITAQAATLELYDTLTQAIFGFMQKLAGAGDLLEGDTRVNADRKAQLLTELLLIGLGRKA